MIPVVIVHQGYKDYLKYNLDITSKNNKVFIIGDESLRVLENNNVELCDIKNYLETEIVKSYSNNFTNYTNLLDYSESSKNHELFCFLRIIFIHMFMKEYNFEKVFHLDSDNVLYYDINEYPFEKDISYQFGINDYNFDMTDSIHNGLINLEFCQKFENLFEKIYIDKDTSLINKKINYHKYRFGGRVCDMDFLFSSQEEKNNRCRGFREAKKNWR